MLEIGDKVELVFSTTYVGGLHRGVRGKVTELDGGEISGVLWDTGLEQELKRPGVNTYRLASRAFSTKLQGDGRLIMQFLGVKAVPPLRLPQPGDRVEFLFSVVRFGNKYLHEGARGAVLNIDDLGTIHVSWDNGAIFSLVPDWDHFRVLPKEAGGE